jgi:hypothetical protein
MKDGGQAYPNVDHNSLGYLVTRDKGMTLRDYFAAAAMQGMISSTHEDFDASSDACARQAYKYADAMLEARK